MCPAERKREIRGGRPVRRRAHGCARRPTHVKLGESTRYAIEVAPDAAFELSVDGSVRRVHFSIAGLGGRPGRVRFSLQQKAILGWDTVFSEVVDDDEWRDRRAEVAGRVWGRQRFRFVTESLEPAEDPVPSALWGSVTFTAPIREAVGRPASHPSVVLISLDTLGAAYLGSFPGAGAEDVSPHIDAFLAESFSFRRAYSHYPATLVSHASLFSALYPIHHGHYGITPRSFTTLVQQIAQKGYRTAAFTENAYVSSGFGFATGFDRYEDGVALRSRPLSGQAERTFERAARWLEDARDTQFFLFVHTYEVHAPYVPRDAAAWAVAQRLTPNDISIPSSSEMLKHNRGTALLNASEIARLRALHFAEIHYLDRLVGLFLDRLEELGLAEDVLVVLTSDHGDQFGEHGKVGHGTTLHNRLLHVPLGFRWPAHVAGGSGEMAVQLVDVMPTILELAGFPVPEGLDGRSLAPLVRGDATQTSDRAAFSEMMTRGGQCVRKGVCELAQVAVQTEHFKLIASLDGEVEALYDLDLDPLETRDVSGLHPEELERHRRLIAAYLETRRENAQSASNPSIDAETRERLRELGYLE